MTCCYGKYLLLSLKITIILSYANSYEWNGDGFLSRETISLDGLWKFKISPKDDQEIGFREQWYNSSFKEYIDMPVPSSFNDITTNSTIRDYLGWVWYQKTSRFPKNFLQLPRLMFRFTSVHYFCKLWIDGYYVGEHEGGHIPFELEWPSELIKQLNKKNVYNNYPTFTVTVAVNNTLNNWTLPQGKLIHQNASSRYPEGYTTYSHDFDYFDYAGINGHVYIYAFGDLIENVQVHTAYYLNRTGYINYSVSSKYEGCECQVILKDNEDKIIAKITGCLNKITVNNATPWWPIHSGHLPVGYLYTLQALLVRNNDNGEPVITDVYELKVGIRTITWNKVSLLINNVPVYMKGFGMHQDAEIRGRGFDLVQTIRDMNLLKWIGANAVRTSHYPYPKEFIDLTDRMGIMVILESPACSLSNFDEKILARHKFVMSEIYKEFSNHASIIMWSLANEPLSNLKEADHYFQDLVIYMKNLDNSRPITFVTSQTVNNEKAVQHVDIICLNRYSGWYNDGGHLDLIEHQVVSESQEWFDKYQKPLIFTEYGAGALTGQHGLPSTMWSENYQIDLFKEHYKAFDIVKNLGFLIGEMVWNFADFNTPQEYIRPGGCMKGVFTRNRQPKSAAYTTKERFESIVGNCEVKYEWPQLNNIV
ncbi:hypothetical protein O3M35_001279 [Rhynocoris fuscipes]|uniref:Beta-glucuronidase n=1 Tax=Rhynocoris fuscipes TaxID=488301 RepID=A0AAW1DQL4_9HEMI